MLIRLQKFLSDAGICSRRKAEELILQGRVSVNGIPVKELGGKVDTQSDEVYFDEKKVEYTEEFVYIMLHKPEGYITTVKDQFDRPTVLDLAKGVGKRIFPVGRLDYETSGLLLLTNDGDATYKLTHPKHDIEKVYTAKLFGTPDQRAINMFKRGIVVDGIKAQPAKIEITEKGAKYCTCKITIFEGRNRQVRKMCDAIKHPVATLKRIGVGELSLGDLEKGKYRYLNFKEINYIKSIK